MWMSKEINIPLRLDAFVLVYKDIDTSCIEDNAKTQVSQSTKTSKRIQIAITYLMPKIVVAIQSPTRLNLSSAGKATGAPEDDMA